MNVKVQLYQSSQPLEYQNVINAYTKGNLYCVLFKKDGQRVTHKFPLTNVFRVIEDYMPSFKEETKTSQVYIDSKSQ